MADDANPDQTAAPQAGPRHSSRRLLLAAALCLVAVACAIYSFAATRSKPPPEHQADYPAVGTTITDFTGVDPAGKPVSLEDYRGKVVLIEFWGTWCPECRKSLAELRPIYDQWHPKGFEILGVLVEYPMAEKEVRAFLAKEKLPWPQLLDPKGANDALQERFGVGYVPAMFLVDQQGVLRAADPSYRELKSWLRKLL